MKKIFTFLTAILLLVALFAFPASAAGNGSLAMGSASGKQGDTITLNVTMPSNPGLVTMTIRVTYDTSVLQLTNVSNPGLLVGAQLNTSYSSPYTISWVDGAATTNNTQTGTIATFIFKIKDSAPVGATTVSLQFIDSYDTDYNENNFSATSGTVTVNCKSHSYGGYTSTGDAQHSRTCSACGYVETTNHNWNSGTINKPASCKETGEKTYTCSTCNATKKETLPKTSNHSYSAWSKVNDNTHSRTCSVCQKIDSANHSWNSGTITKTATCKEEGVKTYTCTACNATKSETIAKTTDHKYGNWTKVNDATHKHSCSVCQKEETANHSWNSGTVTKQPDCKNTGIKTYTCTACSATKTETIAKTTDHKYGNWTKVNDATHKHSCSVCQKEETANHSWNSGTVTKQPDCKNTGIKTYTCTACSATKTETIAKTTDHKYGSWTKVNDATHKRTCSVCAKEETANHSWNSGKVTKKATCKEAGIKTYTCTGCNATKTETITKLTTHTYDHACDTDCNVCGLARSITHSYQSTWSKDNTSHWHECSVCKDKKDLATHIPGAEATETKAQTCTICSYIIKPALGHKHSYATKWTADDKGHWYACSRCEEKGSYADHIWNDGEVTKDATETETGIKTYTCTVCNTTKEEELDVLTPIPTTEPSVPNATEPASTTPVDTGKDTPTHPQGQFPWWIILVAVIVVGGGIAAFIITKKKKN